MAAERASGCSATSTPRCAPPRSARWRRSATTSETELVRPYLSDANPRIAATAAVVLARSAQPDDRQAAEAALTRLASDASARSGSRREVAIALRQIPDAAFEQPARAAAARPESARGRRSHAERETERAVRLPVRAAAHLAAAEPAAEGAGARRARRATARRSSTRSRTSCADREEDVWVRRHIPATLARIPSQKSMDVLVRGARRRGATASCASSS